MGYGPGRDEWLKKARLFGSASSLAYDDPKILKESCMIFGKLGELCLESGNMQGAEYWFKKETEVGQAIDEDNALQNGALKGSISYHNAILYDRYREYDKAVVQYEDAIQVLGSLYEELQDIYVLLKLAEMQRKEGQMLEKSGDWKQAYKMYVMSLETLNNDCYSENPIFMKYKAVVHMCIGDCFFHEDDPAKAKSYYENEYNVLTKDIDEKIEAEDLRRAASSCIKLGDYYLQFDSPGEALKYFKKSEEFYSSVAIFSKSINDTRLYIEVLSRLSDYEIVLQDFAKAEEWIDKACIFADGITESTKLDSDIRIKDELLRKKRDIKVKRKEKSNSNDAFPSEFESLKTYVNKMKGEISVQTDDEIQTYLKNHIGELCFDFWETHPLFKGRDKVAEMGGLLLKRQSYIRAIKEKDLLGHKWYISGKVTDILIEKMNTVLKYDEEAMVILSFCGCYDLKYAKRVRGGKEEALNDFYKFYESRPFWNYSVSEIKFPKLWSYLTVWIRE